MAMQQLGIGAVLQFESAAAVRSMGRAGKAAKGLQSGLNKIGSGARSIASGVQGAATAMAPAVLAAGAAVGGTIKQFSDFRTEIAKIETISPRSASEVRQLSGDILDMSVRFGKSANELASGVYQAISASVPAAESLEFMDLATRTATGGFANTADVVKALAGITQAYGAQLGETATFTERAAKAGDILAKTVEKGVTTIPELSSAMGTVGASAAEFGVSLEEVGAALATMTTMNETTASASTALNQAILAFAKPSRQAIDTAEGLGFELNGTLLRTKGLAGAMAYLSEKIGDDDEAIGKIFGSVRAFKAALKLTGSGAHLFSKNLESMAEAGGTVQKQFETVASTPSVQFSQAMQGLKSMAIEVGGALYESLGVQGVGGLGQWLRDITPKVVEFFRVFGEAARKSFGQTIEKIRSFSQTLSPLLKKLGIMKEGSGGVAEMLGNLAGKLAVIMPAIMGVGMVLSPLMSLLGAIGSIGGGLISVLGGIAGLFTSIGGILTAALIPVLAALAGAIKTVVGDSHFMGTIITSVKDTFTEFWNAIKPVVEEIQGPLTQAIYALINGLSQVLKPVLSVISNMIKALKPIIVAVVEGVQRLITPIVELAQKIGSFLNKVLEKLKPLLSGVAWLFKNVLVPAIEITIGIITELVELLGKVWDFLWDNPMDKLAKQAKATEQAVGGLWSGIAVEMAKQKIQTAANRAELGKMVSEVGKLAEAEKQMEASAKVRAAMPAEERGRFAAGFKKVGEYLTASASRVIGATREARQEDVRKATRRRKDECINVSNKMHVGGSEIASATSKARVELTERAGAGLQPWQRRIANAQGEVSATATRG